MILYLLTIVSVATILVPHSHVCLCTQSCLNSAHQASLSMGFFRQEYWSGLPFPTLGDLPDPGTEPTSLVFPALAGGFFATSATWEALPCS